MLARQVLAAHGYQPAEPMKLAANFTSLKLFSAEDQFNALDAVLQEITAKEYSGYHPPEKSYEEGVMGDDLFAFAWDSIYLRRRIYFKFCLHKEQDESFTLHVASLHRENPRRRT